MNFDNFMKCISDLSYSGMFTKENSKKFDFARIVNKDNDVKNDMIIKDQDNNEKNLTKSNLNVLETSIVEEKIRFAG